MSTLFPYGLEPHPECHVASVQLINYKAAGDLRLELGRRLHVFVGDNGAGKTTVLDGIAAGLANVASKAGPGVCGAERLLLSQETIRRKEGQVAAQGAVALRMGSGWSVKIVEVQGRSVPVFATDYYEAPPIPEKNAITWFNDHWAVARQDADDYIPLFVYYTSDRAILSNATSRKADGPPRRADAFRDAFSAAISYRDLVSWFSVMERAELYEMRRRKDLEYRDPLVDSVRQAVRSVVPGVKMLSSDPQSGHLLLEMDTDAGHNRFTLDELSGGGRVMVALVADLARRMIQANPHLGLNSPAVVLIDEIDLHLHPKWQATVVDDLMRTFPNAQFILSTHSEQLIPTVPSELVRSVRVTPDGIKAYAVGPLEGASFERVLEDGMGLSGSRPVRHQDLLTHYWALVDAGEGESPAGLALRAQLDDLFQGQEPDLLRADVVIRRLRARRGDR